MIGFIIFMVIVVAIVTLVVIKKKKKTAQEKKEAYIELMERATDIGNELIKNGYTVEYQSESDFMAGRHTGGYSISAWISRGDEQVGSMHFGTWGPGSSMGSTVRYNKAYNHRKNSHNIGSMEHMIHLDKSATEINSYVPCSEPPPEWMKTCAKVLRLSGFTISYPEWMEEYPEAKQYVNVVFQE